jgi:hypothetical protein
MRLSANFVNLEVTVTGVPKLRIPITLLREKQRTAKRFSVTLLHCPYVTEIPTLPKFLPYRNSYLTKIPILPKFIPYRNHTPPVCYTNLFPK